MNNIPEVLRLFKSWHYRLQQLKKGLTESGQQQDILDVFLAHLEMKVTDENRFIAYSRLETLKEDGLLSYAEKQKFSKSETSELIEKAYKYTQVYYLSAYSDIILEIEKNDLLSDFYLTLIQTNFEIGKHMCDWHRAWKKDIIEDINVELEEKFTDAKSILAYLEKNNLLEFDTQGNIADRSYSSLVRVGEGYEKKAYIDVFPLEISKIVMSLENTINKLTLLTDAQYNRKEEYLAYFVALKDAFLETDTNKLIEKWSQIDIAWMSVDTPFQIGHPLEFYEDLYRKSVAPEWDFRIQDTSILESTVTSNISDMYEKLYDEIGREEYKSSYEYSLKNKDRVQLYISTPAMIFGSELSGMFSAQVVPNDDKVSAQYGKKIFAYPEFILESQKNAPEFLLTHNTFETSFLDKNRAILQNRELYYSLYDIETIGHEFGHTLWLDLGVESKMNAGGNFKNIEEFKATAGGLVSYFMGDKSDLDEDIFVTHIMRCIKMMKYRSIDDIVPYYCECLIHLDILLISELISIKNNKIIFHPNNIDKAKELYIKSYKALIYTYLDQNDASDFLYNYVDQNGKIFLPKNQKLKDFVEFYYSEYKKIGNKIISNL